jgi:hypothetical protein
LEKDSLVKLMSSDEKEKAPSNERYTIFHALLDAMKEKQQKKSRRERFLRRLGCVGSQTAFADTKPEFQDEQESSVETSDSDIT